MTVDPAPVAKRREVTHACPVIGSQFMSCCGKTPWDVPATDRMTLDAALVDCEGR